MTNENHLDLAKASGLSIETVRRWAKGRHVAHSTDFLLRAKCLDLGIQAPPNPDARSAEPAVAVPR